MSRNQRILELEKLEERYLNHMAQPLYDYMGTELKSNDPCPWCRYFRGEVRDLSQFETETVPRSNIAETISKRIIELAGPPPMNDEEFVNYLSKIVNLFKTYLDYDEIHANAERYWNSLAYTFLTPGEVLRLGRGSSSELSLALLTVLKRIGLPVAAYRPGYSHISLIVQNPVTGSKYMIDPTFGKIEKTPDILIRKSENNEDIYGPLTLEELWRNIVEERRRLGEKYIGMNYTPEEALDYEYARHCIYPLPYGTEKGRKYLEYLKEIGYCQTLFTPDEKVEAMIFSSEIVRCPRPEDPNISIEEKASCYRKAWERFRRSLEYYREEIARLRPRRR
ncbi:MAG: hypothetical protein GXO26_08225 [Crenarchaeota archaeon]|nr:hypothetical protein [Thermoproteota archaeon]